MNNNNVIFLKEFVIIMYQYKNSAQGQKDRAAINKIELKTKNIHTRQSSGATSISCIVLFSSFCVFISKSCFHTVVN